jgi:peptidyl-tRNA hydrolase, PTH1 family
MAKLIVGLGNPGTKYLWTRHNAGFMVLDQLSGVSGISVTRKNFSGLYGEGNWQGERLLLLKPQTFMNLSGKAAAEALRFHKLSLQELIVIHDDLDVPFGQIKLKDGGGHAGHNGLRSLMQEFGGGDFIRVRLGIGRPVRGAGADYVLAPFSREETELLPRLLEASVEIIQILVREGIAKAMSFFHNRDLLT